jgi:hypothetical protein
MVLTPQGVRFSTNDAYYHALRVKRTLQDFPRVPVHDPGLAYPAGATVPWPPLFDGGVAMVARAVGGRDGAESAALRIAAWTPWIVGVLTVLGTLVSASLLMGPWEGVLAACFLAILPGHVAFTRVGDFDQHGAEVLLLIVSVTALVSASLKRADGGTPVRDELVLASSIALAFLVWQGSVLHLAILAGIVAFTWAVGGQGKTHHRAGAVVLLRSAVAAALMLALCAAVLVSPGTLVKMSLLGVTGFHVGAVMCVAMFAALLCAMPEMASAQRRVGQVGAATAGTVGFALIIPGFGDVVAHGLTSLTAGTPWHRNIQEFDPLFFAGYTPWTVEARRVGELLGLTLLLAPAALSGLVRRWPEDPGAANRRATLLWFGVGLIVLALMRKRFLVYAAVPLSMWAAAFIVPWARRAGADGKSLKAAGVGLTLSLLVLWPTFAWHARAFEPAPPPEERMALFTALEWLGTREPARPDRPGVLAEWDFGHLIQYVAGKPVLVSPFGTDVGESPMVEFARGFLSPHGDTLVEVMDRSRMGFFLLTNPATESHYARAYLTPPPPELVSAHRDWRSGLAVTVNPAFWRTAASRLFFEDGSGSGGVVPAVSGLRLVFEAGPVGLWEGRQAPAFKIFERVPGAVLKVSGLTAGQMVTAEVGLMTGAGRVSRWVTSGRAGGTGQARLSIPYASGMNGAVWATPARVAVGSGSTSVVLGERDVLEGRVRAVVLPEAGRATPPRDIPTGNGSS